MRHRTICILLVAVFSCGGAPAFDPDAALATYRERFEGAAGPVETDGAALFVIVDAEVPPGLPGGASRVSLTELHKALVSWIDGMGAEEQSTPVSPFCPLLSDFVLPDIEFELPKVDSVVVEDTAKDGRIRHVTAMELAPLAKLRAEVAAKKGSPRKLDEWVSLLSESRANLRSEKERELFLSLLGCPDALVSSKPSARCFGEGVDLVEMSASLALWNPETAGPADCRRLLAAAPAFAPAWRSLAGVSERAEEWPEAVACLLAANAADPQKSDFATFCASAKGKGGSPAWDEFAELLPRLVASAPENGRTNALWRYVFRTAGHLDFTPTGRPDGGAFDEAMALWRRARTEDLPVIVDRIQTSLESDPARADPWKYLGAALRASGKPEQALVAYNEAARLSPGDAECVAYQAALYRTLGCPAMADGAAWRVLLSSPSGKISAIVRPILLASHPESILP